MHVFALSWTKVHAKKRMVHLFGVSNRVQNCGMMMRTKYVVVVHFFQAATRLVVMCTWQY